jgi:hypothetical protein
MPLFQAKDRTFRSLLHIGIFSCRLIYLPEVPMGILPRT